MSAPRFLEVWTRTVDHYAPRRLLISVGHILAIESEPGSGLARVIFKLDHENVPRGVQVDATVDDMVRTLGSEVSRVDTTNRGARGRS